MITAARECPSCRAALPADAAFCHRCGTSTPTGINQATGEIQALERSRLAESARRAAVQNALGDTCEVRRLLGRGGFAEVYVVFDKRLKREIAVKTIRGDLVVNEMLLERFQREAEAVAKLRHPNVCPIFSVGENHGVAYFTMPLIEGESLAAALEREGTLPLRESLRILREASLALHAAHRAGIVHRDVKPDNIMLEGADRSVVVMDFGIAKSEGGDAKGLTGTGLLVGTPHYMSPEQAMGEHTLDARSDQYALATIGYRMLTGRAPFEGGSVQNLLFKTVTEVPPPACEISPDVPKEVSDALAKALSKRRENRYESMAAFAASLAPFEHQSTDNIESARGRRRVDLATRVRAMQAAVPSLRKWVLAAVPAAAAAFALFVVATPRAPLVVAGNRGDALFAARTFLNARGAPGGREEFVDFATEDSTFRFLQKQLGLTRMQQRAMTDAPVWYWMINSVSATAKDQWKVWIGPENRIIGFLNVIPDSAKGVSISVDSARALAEGELASRGLPFSRLERLRDSTVSRKARTDYVFRWKELGSAITWRGGDSGYVQPLVTVAGDRVVEFKQKVKIPDAYPFTRVSEDWLIGMMVLPVLLAVMVLGVSIVRRQQTDELQWGSMIRLATFFVVAQLILQSPKFYETAMVARAVGGPGYVAIVAELAGWIFLGAVGLCVAAAGESLAYAKRPDVVAGISDMALGRLTIPEIVPAAARGYLFGSLMTLVSALGLFVALRLGAGGPFLPSLPFGRIPIVDGLLIPPLYAILKVFALLFVVAVFLRVPYVSKGAIFVPAVILGIFGTAGGNGAASVLSTCAHIALLTYALWRYGVLTAIVAVIVSESIERLAALIRTGDARSLLGAAALLAVMAIPAVLAVLTVRRFSEASANRADLRTPQST